MIVIARTEEVAIQRLTQRKWRVGFIEEHKHKVVIGHKKILKFIEWIVDDQGFVLVRSEDDSDFQVYGREVEVELNEPDWAEMV